MTRLRVCGALGEAGGGAAGGAGAGAVILAARMHSSKRTLRSNDIAVPPLDVELDLCFSLQYPHFVKRDGNRYLQDTITNISAKFSKMPQSGKQSQLDIAKILSFIRV